MNADVGKPVLNASWRPAAFRGRFLEGLFHSPNGWPTWPRHPDPRPPEELPPPRFHPGRPGCSSELAISDVQRFLPTGAIAIDRRLPYSRRELPSTTYAFPTCRARTTFRLIAAKTACLEIPIRAAPSLTDISPPAFGTGRVDVVRLLEWDRSTRGPEVSPDFVSPETFTSAKSSRTSIRAVTPLKTSSRAMSIVKALSRAVCLSPMACHLTTHAQLPCRERATSADRRKPLITGRSHLRLATSHMTSAGCHMTSSASHMTSAGCRTTVASLPTSGTKPFLG
jgi:hypothetical protein